MNDGNEVNNEKSNPTSTDTDGDGRDDGQEVDKTDPKQPLRLISKRARLLLSRGTASLTCERLTDR